MFCVFRTIHPPFVVLGFYHENAISRNDNVVNLHRPYITANINVVENVILFGQLRQSSCNPIFSIGTFPHEGSTDRTDDNEKHRG